MRGNGPTQADCRVWQRLNKNNALFLAVVVLAINGFAGIASASDGRDHCPSGPIYVGEHSFVAKDGPFVRANGDEVGIVDVKNLRYGWTDRKGFDNECEIGGMVLRYSISRNPHSPNNYVYFRISGEPYAGGAVLRTVVNQSSMFMYRPTAKNRQQRISIAYFNVQPLSDIFRDVIFVVKSLEVN